MNRFIRNGTAYFFLGLAGTVTSLTMAHAQSKSGVEKNSTSISALSSNQISGSEVILASTRLTQLNRRNPVIDTDMIDIPGKVCGISRVRIEAADYDIRIESLTLNFNNHGVKSYVNISLENAFFDAPTMSAWIDVPGRTRCVDSVVLRGYTSEHRSRYTRNIQGLVNVIGAYNTLPAPNPINDGCKYESVDFKEIEKNDSLIPIGTMDISGDFGRKQIEARNIQQAGSTFLGHYGCNESTAKQNCVCKPIPGASDKAICYFPATLCKRPKLGGCETGYQLRTISTSNWTWTVCEKTSSIQIGGSSDKTQTLPAR